VALERLVEAALAQGLSAIGVTDHDDCSGGFAVAEYCARRGIPPRVYPGSEISALHGPHDVHILGVDLVENVAPWRSVEATVEAVLRQGGFVVMPHPKRPGGGHPSFGQILSSVFRPRSRSSTPASGICGPLPVSCASWMRTSKAARSTWRIAAGWPVRWVALTHTFAPLAAA
jgi:hypothetical protein